MDRAKRLRGWVCSVLPRLAAPRLRQRKLPKRSSCALVTFGMELLEALDHKSCRTCSDRSAHGAGLVSHGQPEVAKENSLKSSGEGLLEGLQEVRPLLPEVNSVQRRWPQWAIGGWVMADSEFPVISQALEALLPGLWLLLAPYDS